MKKTREVLGLPVISISDGNEAGKVKDILINAEKGMVDYFIVDSGMQALNVKTISAHDVLGIGEYALTIENPDVIKDINSIPAAVELLQKDVKVKNTRVLTKKGRLIGETGDICIDEDNLCSVSGLEFIPYSDKDRLYIIPRDCVITFGKNLIITQEDVESRFLTDTSGLTGNSGKADTADRQAEAQAEKAAGMDEAAAANEMFENAAETDTALDAMHEDGTNAASLFEQKQKQYLMGRRALKTIADNNGNIIIGEGEMITEQIIDTAKQCGKLIELVMNNQE